MSNLSATLAERPLVDATMRPDAASIAELFREHARGLASRARRVLGSQADAEDAVQEVMLTLLETPGVLASVDRLVGWLYTLVRRRAIDILRSESRRHRREGEDLVEELLDRAADQAVMLEDEELARALADAIRALPPVLRETVTAHSIEGVTFRELSERTGVPMGTLMARKKRAADRIRDHLRREGWIAGDRTPPARKGNRHEST